MHASHARMQGARVWGIKGSLRPFGWFHRLRSILMRGVKTWRRQMPHSVT